MKNVLNFRNFENKPQVTFYTMINNTLYKINFDYLNYKISYMWVTQNHLLPFACLQYLLSEYHEITKINEIIVIWMIQLYIHSYFVCVFFRAFLPIIDISSVTTINFNQWIQFRNWGKMPLSVVRPGIYAKETLLIKLYARSNLL